VAISNHVYGYLNSPELAVQPSTTYHVSAWMRGEIDTEESAANWLLRVYYYDASHAALSYVNVAVGSTAPSSWTEQGGDFTTPSNAAYVRIQLYNYMNSGWVAWDDVRLTGPAVTTQYYYAGGQRVALRKNGVLHYLLGDHLGSTALTAYDDGVRGAELRYRAWGETRYAWESTPTTFQYTGQRNDAIIGLLFYNARYYDSALGRFIQADTIVPNPAHPQDLNRYSYAANNPLRFSDPSGHWYYDPGCDCLVQTDADYNEWPENLYYVNGAHPPLVVPSKAACDALAGTSSPCRTEVIGGPIGQFGLIGLAILFEPADWALTFNQWAHGNFSAWDLAGLLPFVSGQVDNVGDALHLRAGQAGRFADLDARRVVGDDLTPHHMPQKALGHTSETNGGALVMTTAEHAQTRTYGWRGGQAAMEDAGKPFREVLATDIRDVRSITGSLYNSGLRDLINYYRTNFPDLMKKR